MAATTLEFHELIRLLEEHPEWRAELRRVMFPQDVLDLPPIVQELAAAQQRTEEALVRLTERVDQIAANQERIWEAMEKGFAEAAADRKRMWEAMEKSFDETAAYRKATWKEVSRLKGITCEMRYHSRADAFFGRVLTRGHNATPQVADLLY